MADTYDFPDELLKAQHDLQTTRAELSDLYRRLPRYTEPMEAYTDWRGVDHPACEGWREEDFAAVNALRARETELAVYVNTHEFWTALRDRRAVVAARTALKHALDAPEAERETEEADAAPER